MRAVLRHTELDPAFKAEALRLPDAAYIAEQLDVVDPQAIHAAVEAAWDQLSAALRDDWAWAFEAHQVAGGYSPNAADAGKRALANLALAMLVRGSVAQGDPVWPGRAYQRVKVASNMTERFGALAALVHAHAPSWPTPRWPTSTSCSPTTPWSSTSGSCCKPAPPSAAAPCSSAPRSCCSTPTSR